ncbi:uncharacterized protein A4U43_C09F8330 [Asparagus officinalis]|uniref:Uncharacterized protein n=1 Tax=Asparagus officinalis TaxID=4686 RepID=A0A5P1E6E0_ASPOF|nr:uncharacterized protein A4U43_C09F8330 [Asparagus officinalis]
MSASAGEDSIEATLELTLISTDLVKKPRPSSSSPFAAVPSSSAPPPTLPLSSLCSAAADVRTLQLRKPSGRGRGTVCIAARIFWSLGVPILDADCQNVGKIVDPTAPPMPQEQDWVFEGVEGGFDSKEMEMVDESRGSEGICEKEIGLGEMGDVRETRGAWRSFLVGFASGALAAVLVGAAGFSEG